MRTAFINLDTPQMGLNQSDIKWLKQFEGFHYAVDNTGRYADTLRLAKKYISSNTRVLDLGMYPGHLSLILKRDTGAKITGISFAHSRSFEKQMKMQGIDVLTLDITRNAVPFPDGSFDVILCTEIIEHLDRPLYLLMETNRLLKNNGILILSTPNHASLKCRMNLLAGQPTNRHLFGVDHVFQMNEWVHRREYTSGEICRMITATGFDVERKTFTKLEHSPKTTREYITSILKNLLYMIPSLKGGIILSARKNHEAKYTSIVPDVLKANIIADIPDIRIPADENIELNLAIENTGNTIWLCEKKAEYGFVRIGGHLRDEDENLIDYDFFRHELPHDIMPGSKHFIPVTFRAPSTAGRYILEIDFVNEGISWFKDYGSETLTVSLTVIK